MYRPVQLAACLFLAGAVASADIAQTLERADALDEEGRNQEALATLQAALGAAKSGGEAAEIAWRLSRASMNLGNAAQKAGGRDAQLLPYFESGERYGQMAIDADPRSELGYFWKAGNAGRWGQVRGLLNALGKTRDMVKLLAKAIELKPTHRDSYYVLGQLHGHVPGFPIGFGNIDYAVSLSRKAVDLLEQEVRSGSEKRPDYDFAIELAKNLARRNWSASRRAKAALDDRSAHAAASDELTRSFTYESSITLPKMSDREEAREIVARAIDALQAIARRRPGEEAALAKARETLAELR
jgi:tetratricopeptide (TPR) repeat protein